MPENKLFYGEIYTAGKKYTAAVNARSNKFHFCDLTVPQRLRCPALVSSSRYTTRRFCCHKKFVQTLGKFDLDSFHEIHIFCLGCFQFIIRIQFVMYGWIQVKIIFNFREHLFACLMKFQVRKDPFIAAGTFQFDLKEKQMVGIVLYFDP